jgi:hypothetical protein
MRTARLITTFTVAGALSMFFACSDSAKLLGTSDKVVDDTLGQDSSSPPPPGPTDGGGDGADGYGPTMILCASCACDPTKNYCFSGGSGSALTEGGSDDSGSDGDTSHRPAFPFSGFGEPDGAAEAGPPPPPCPVVAAGQLGCIPLPTACAANATCPCLLDALQAQYPTCYLVCTPTPGFLSVYCGG